MQSRKCVHRGFITLALVTGLLAGCSPEVPEESSLRQGTQALTLSEPILLRDINPRAQGPKPDQFVAVNGTLFFVSNGQELWKSDGTEAGTVRVRTLTESGGIQHLTAAGGAVFFLHGLSLWKSDGTEAGTVVVKTPLSPHQVLSLVEMGGRLFIFTWEGVWVSDGTQAGTVLLKSFTINFFVNAYRPVVFNGALFFNARIPGGGMGLWRSDGTAAGTVPVLNVADNAPGSNPHELVVSNGTLFFMDYSRDVSSKNLWKSDGTAAGTVLVKGGLLYPQFLTAVNGRLFFFSDPNSSSPSLWTSDGTTAGTVSIARFGGFTQSPMAVNGGLLFAVRQGDTRTELWWSGGMAHNTVRLQEVCAGSGAPSSVAPLASVRGVALLSARCGEDRELWKSDGTVDGTVRVKDGLLYFSQGAAELNGTLFFSTDDGAVGPELWKSDGTAAGTVPVIDSVKGLAPSEPHALVAAGTTAFFFATDANDKLRLWKSDGTPEGTVPLQELADTTANSPRPSDLTAVNGQVFFTLFNSLYRSDGTPTGMKSIRTFSPSKGSLSLSALTGLGGTLFFATQDEDSAELWKSDGTPEGTVLVTEIPTEVRRQVSHMVVLNGKLLFIVGNYSRSAELWESDGTAAGTRRLKVLFQTAESFQGSVNSMVVADGKVFFMTYGDPPSLWQSDGTEAGTVKVPGVYETVTTPDGLAWTKGKLLVLAQGGRKLWVVDKGQTTSIKELFPYPTGGSYGRSFIGHIGHVRGTLHYSVYNATHGRWELWRTDGTSVGTQRVPLLELGPADWQTTGASTAFVEAGNRLFFVRDGGQGREPWVLPYAPIHCPVSPYPADADDARGAQVPLPAAPRATGVDPALPVTYSHASGSHFPMGTTRVSITANDPAYPASTCALDVIVTDLRAPGLQCPTSLEVKPSGKAGAVVEYPPATATDKVSSAEALVLEYSHPSGSTFPVGTTTVEVKATDEAGNSETCSFSVRVAEPGLLSCGGCGAASAGQALGWLLARAPMVARRRARPSR